MNFSGMASRSCGGGCLETFGGSTAPYVYTAAAAHGHQRDPLFPVAAAAAASNYRCVDYRLSNPVAGCTFSFQRHPFAIQELLGGIRRPSFEGLTLDDSSAISRSLTLTQFSGSLDRHYRAEGGGHNPGESITHTFAQSSDIRQFPMSVITSATNPSLPHSKLHTGYTSHPLWNGRVTVEHGGLMRHSHAGDKQTLGLHSGDLLDFGYRNTNNIKHTMGSSSPNTSATFIGGDVNSCSGMLNILYT